MFLSSHIYESILLKDCSWILTQNHQRRIIKGGSILIREGLISKVSTQPLSAASAEMVIDGKNKVVLPGFVDAHTHLSSSLFRGLTENVQHEKGSEDTVWFLEKKLKGDLCYWGSLLSCLEMIKSGTTCCLDLSFYPEDVAKGAMDAGLRVSIAPVITSSNDNNEWIRKISHIQELKDPCISVAIAPFSPTVCSENILLQAKEFAEKEGIPLTIHLAETRKEQVEYENRYRMREIEYLAKVGFLTSYLVAAHMVWLTRREVKMLAENKVKIVHCPVSNMRWATGGVAPVPEMLGEGITVSLGTDGVLGAYCLDMFDTMKSCAMIHKSHRWDRTEMAAPSVLDMATTGGAEALGLSQRIGSISEGKAADIIIIDMNSPNLRPIQRPTVISHIVNSAKGGNVDTVIVEGRLLMHKKKLVTLTESKIYSAIDDVISRLN